MLFASVRLAFELGSPNCAAFPADVTHAPHSRVRSGQGQRRMLLKASQEKHGGQKHHFQGCLLPLAGRAVDRKSSFGSNIRLISLRVSLWTLPNVPFIFAIVKHRSHSTAVPHWWLNCPLNPEDPEMPIRAPWEGQSQRSHCPLHSTPQYYLLPHHHATELTCCGTKG